MTVAAIQPDVRAVTAFASTVERLHWSSAMLTRTIHSYATRLKTLSTLPAPNVCGDVQAWVAGRYLKLPASAVSFDRRYYKVEVAVGEVLARAEKIEGQLSEAEANAVYTWGHIMESLALSP
jgi:hypothetical protein